MDEFGRNHAGKEVSSDEFLAAAEKANGKPIGEGVRGLLKATTPLSSPCWAVDGFDQELDKSLIVYGTVKDVAAQREAAERLQRQIARRWPNFYVPVKSDVAATDADLRSRHVLLVGRPETNAATAKLAKHLPVSFGSGSFKVRDDVFAHASSGVIATGTNPLNHRYQVVVFAGLGAEATWHCVEMLPGRKDEAANVVILAVGTPTKSLVERERPLDSGKVSLKATE